MQCRQEITEQHTGSLARLCQCQEHADNSPTYPPHPDNHSDCVSTAIVSIFKDGITTGSEREVRRKIRRRVQYWFIEQTAQCRENICRRGFDFWRGVFRWRQTEVQSDSDHTGAGSLPKRSHQEPGIPARITTTRCLRKNWRVWFGNQAIFRCGFHLCVESSRVGRACMGSCTFSLPGMCPVGWQESTPLRL